MWVLTIRSPWHEPREYVLKAGKTILGRKPDNDVVIADESASRVHAEIEYNARTNTVVLRDLGSTNGTFVNRERVSRPHPLQPEDQIRIGQHAVTLTFRDERLAAGQTSRMAGTRPLTRDMVLEAVDRHALVLYEVATRLNTIFDLDTALRETSRLIETAIGADRCEVIPAERFDRLGELGFPTALARQAIDQRVVVYIPDLSTEPNREISQSATLLQVRSVLCVPCLIGEELVALAYAYRAGESARAFDQHDVQLVLAVSHQAALTIQRTHLLEKARRLEQQTMTDSLTGLSNRRHFFELAEEEFQRARRYKRPLAAMLADIDGLKQINDNHGQSAGDQVLRAVAACLRNNLREAHLLGRYGGDEFVVLLLECDLVAALSVADRIRQRISEMSVTTDAGPQRVALSAGCSVLGPAVLDLTALIAQADTALQAAKKRRQLNSDPLAGTGPLPA